MTRSNQLQTMPFVKHPNSYAYGLNLLDISIAGKSLNLPPNSFTIKLNGQRGCINDCGSVLTVIECEVYAVLTAEFIDYFSQHDIEKLFTCRKCGVTCFNLPARFNSFPSMTYHFQGADLVVEPENVFIFNHQDSFFFFFLAQHSHLGKGRRYWEHGINIILSSFMILIHFELYFAPENCA